MTDQDDNRPLPPLASVLECTVVGQDTGEGDGKVEGGGSEGGDGGGGGGGGGGGEAAVIALGLATGEVVAVRMKRPALRHLAIGTMRVLRELGDRAAKVVGSAYEQCLRSEHATGRELEESQMSQIEPVMCTDEEFVAAHPRPFTRASGAFLKVRFPGEPKHRRIAILAGWSVDTAGRGLAMHRADGTGEMLRYSKGMFVLCRWKVLIEGKPRFRDFFVLLPGTDASCRDILFFGRRLGAVEVHRARLVALDLIRPGTSESAIGVTIERLPISTIAERTRYITYLAEETATHWEQNGFWL